MTYRPDRSRLFKFAAGLVAALALLTACTPMPKLPEAPRSEPVAAAAAPSPVLGANSATVPVVVAARVSTPARLGTQWGEGVESAVQMIDVKRLSERPDDVASIAYNDAAGVRRDAGHRPERRLNLQLAQGDVEWSVEDENNRPLPLQRARRSSSAADGFQLAGSEGQRYKLRLRNLSDRRYEVVATVDGLDVLTGRPGSLRNGGYVLGPQAVVVIEGFRKSDSEVAAFRFSAPGRSYAANTEAGDVRNLGVIGAALFELQPVEGPRRPRRNAAPERPNAFPADGSYAPPPRYRK